MMLRPASRSKPSEAMPHWATAGTVAVRKGGAGRKQGVMARDEFVARVVEESATKALG